MINSLLDLQQEVSEGANLTQCKECKFFVANNEGKSPCNFNSNDPEDCDLLVVKFGFLP